MGSRLYCRLIDALFGGRVFETYISRRRRGFLVVFARKSEIIFCLVIDWTQVSKNVF